MGVYKKFISAVCAAALCIQSLGMIPTFADNSIADGGVAVVSIDSDQTQQEADLSKVGIDEDYAEKYLKDVDVTDDPTYRKMVDSQGKVGLTDFSSLVTHQARFNNFGKIYGVDVSVYNGDIDFEQLKNEGYKFVIVRAGARGYASSGTIIEDSRFEEHVDNAHKAGLMVGAYFYTQAVNNAEAKVEADITLKKLAGRKLELPIYFDIEPAYNANGLPGRLVAAKLSKAQKADLCNYFCNYIKSKGYDSGITSCMSWFITDIEMSMIENKHDIWLAHYTSNTSYSGQFDMWQFASTRKVPGIASPYTDQDVRYLEFTKPYGDHALKASGDINNVTLSWNRTSNTMGYIVYKKDPAGKVTKVGTTTSNSFKLARENTQMQYYVQSYNIYEGAYYYSDNSNIVTVSGKTVSGIKTVTASQNSVTVSWDALTGAAGYCVYLEDKPVGTVNDTQYTFSGLAMGSVYKIKVAAYYNTGSDKKYSSASVVLPAANYSIATSLVMELAANIKKTTLAGSDRYATAAKIAQQAYPSGSYSVVLTTGASYADSLAAVPLAQSLNSPIILTDPTTLSSAALSEIQRLKAKSVFIVGGTGAVSSGIESTLKNKGYNVFRIGQSTRYSTAAYVAMNTDYVRKKTPSEVFFVSADGYADSLALGNIAAVRGAVMLYINKNGTLDSVTQKYLDSIKGNLKNVYIVGGTGVISSNAEKNLKSYGTVKRIGGSNRYSTCLMLNNQFASSVAGRSVCLTTGLNYPDALAGGVLAANCNAPILLVDTGYSKDVQSYINNKAPNAVYVFGGSGVTVK